MQKPRHAIHFHVGRFIAYIAMAIGVNMGIWALVIVVSDFGLLMPDIDTSRFNDLGFFAISTFGMIIFLAMIPLQNAAGNLSAGFFSRVYQSIRSQFALYILLIAALQAIFFSSFDHISFYHQWGTELYVALVISCIFSILLHKYWMIQLLHQPWIVYKYVKFLRWEDAADKLWLELYECTYRAIKAGRINDANYFLQIMGRYFEELGKDDETIPLKSDIQNLYKVAADLSPTRRLMEKRWPFISKQ